MYNFAGAGDMRKCHCKVFGNLAKMYMYSIAHTSLIARYILRKFECASGDYRRACDGGSPIDGIRIGALTLYT